MVLYEKGKEQNEPTNQSERSVFAMVRGEARERQMDCGVKMVSGGVELTSFGEDIEVIRGEIDIRIENLWTPDLVRERRQHKG